MAYCGASALYAALTFGLVNSFMFLSLTVLALRFGIAEFLHPLQRQGDFLRNLPHRLRSREASADDVEECGCRCH